MKTISHSGFVTAINDREAVITIRCASACLHCRLKNGCTAADVKFKQITVSIPEQQNLHLGQTVTIGMDERQGWIALFLAYILPLLLVLFVLLGVLFISANETFAALLSLGVLPPYYFLLTVFKKKLSDRFQFHIVSE